MSTEGKLTFEESLKRLEEIVHALESGDTPLEQSISLFEEGVKLSGHCNKLLETAEQKVTVLTKDSSGVIREEAMTEMQNEYV
ncbi:MAG: exodeoxyribonuclease VII small subunit [Clostridia bacterium]|nr:exodeoxyribonuclease VII small subunit [Clostridia bacterium]